MKLKQILNSKKLTLKALSEISGVPQHTIEDIERNDSCKVETAIKLPLHLV